MELCPPSTSVLRPPSTALSWPGLVGKCDLLYRLAKHLSFSFPRKPAKWAQPQNTAEFQVRLRASFSQCPPPPRGHPVGRLFLVNDALANIENPKQSLSMSIIHLASMYGASEPVYVY